MNMRWACTWPLLTTLAFPGINLPALGQAPAPVGYPPVAMMPPGAAAYDPAMMAAMQGGSPAGAYSPAAMYMPAAAFPSQGMQPGPYMMPAGPIGPPDVNGSYGYMPAEYAAQGYAPQQGYGPQPSSLPGYGSPGYAPLGCCPPAGPP